MRSSRIIAVTLTLLGSAAAQTFPVISSIENAASNIPPGLPNSAIALGSMFVIKGTNLGPPSIVVANSYPLQTTLAGTSVQVTVGDRAVAAILYYTLNRQVAAILPSNVFAGVGTVTVTYNNQTSAAFPITIVVSNVAMFTLDSTGGGAAVATLGDNSLVTATNAPNPGDVIVLWGTGLGPVTGDETRPATGGDLPVIFDAFVGGLPAEVLYRGRNPCCSSLDQINIRLPLGVAGCVVPIQLRVATLVSNTTTIPIAVSGHACTPTNPAVTQQDFQRLLARSNLSKGSITLSRNVDTQLSFIPGIPPAATTTRSDDASAIFQRFVGLSTPAILNSLADFPSVGSCAVVTAAGQTIPSSLTFQTLDAGPSLSLDGPAGTRSIPRQASAGAISYGVNLGIGVARNYFDTGEHTISGGSGADVGSFNARVTVPVPLIWTNQTLLTTINRFLDLTVRWTGGDPAGFVQISGISSIPVGQGSVAAAFNCTARASDGVFNVPSLVLRALPASANVLGQRVPGTLSVKGVNSAPFSASSLDFGTITFFHSYTQTAAFE